MRSVNTMAIGKPVRILIMEDDAGQARLAQRTLQRAGYAVEVASNGDTGLALYETGSYDMLLVDYQMPRTGGLEVLRTLTLRGALPPTIMVTGHGDEAMAVEAMKLGAGDYVVKDIDGLYLTLLPTVVARVLQQQRLLAENRRLEEHLRHSQKIEAIGILAGGIAHDFNNILAAILGFTELAAYDVPPASAAGRCLREVLTAGKRAKELVQQILAFSRKTMTERKPVRLHALLQEALVFLRASLPSTIQIDTHMADETGAVLADATQMHQVLMNLYANAAYAMRHTGGVLEVRLEAVDMDAAVAAVHPDLKPGSYIWLTVRDTGHGMTPEVLEHIFEPYFTTKPQGEGNGMGLAVVHGIVTSHGGMMTVTSAPGQGTTFEVYLPRLAEATPDQPASAADPLPGGTERILFVDDEAAIASLGQEVLTRLGYQVVVCLRSTEALETFRTASPPFDLVITDQTMPYLTGDALARALRDLRPDLPIILCTDFSHTMSAARARSAGIDAVLMKPWQGWELALTIRGVLGQWVTRQP